MPISMEDIKKLKEMTGAALMDAKRTLEETKGNIDEAAKILRKKGLAKAEKRAENAVKEGVVAIAQDSGKVLILRTNCETDFVARTDEFKAYALQSAKDLLAEGAAPGSELSAKSDENRKGVIAKFGENIMLSEWKVLPLKGKVFTYLHMGKVGVAIDFDGAPSEETMKNVAMQIASMNPLGLSKEDIPAAVIDREKEIYTEKAKQSGKPEAILPKIVEGMMANFYKENTLLEQPFVFDESKKISELLGKDKINAFIRVAL